MRELFIYITASTNNTVNAPYNTVIHSYQFLKSEVYT